MEQEIFIDIINSNGKYQITSFGRVYSTRKKIFLSPHLHKGYYEIKIPIDQNYKHQRKLIHRLVCTHFHLNPLNKPHVNHKDSNTLNNRADNLEWCTHQENVKHALLNNRFSTRFSETDIKTIRQLNYQSVPIKDIANHFSAHTSSIYSIVNNKSWLKY